MDERERREKLEKLTGLDKIYIDVMYYRFLDQSVAEIQKSLKIPNIKTVYTAPPYLTVHEHEVELPNGHVIPNYTVTEVPDFTMVFAVTADQKVLLVQYLKKYKRAISYLN